MKKILIVGLLVLFALGAFAGSAQAQGTQPGSGTLHDYIENALAEKLGLPLATVEAEAASGKTLAQIALDHGVAQADLPALMLEIRGTAIAAALKDGVITQAWADQMLKRGNRGMGSGARMFGSGAGTCNGTGVPVGSGMRAGMRWQQQVNP